MLNRYSKKSCVTGTYHFEYGFSLVEILFAMAISSVVCIAAMTAIPPLLKQTHQVYFQYQLDREVRMVLINMEKDFRRIGYCGSSSCQGDAIKISAQSSQRTNSCLIFAYDQDLSGDWINKNTKKIDTDFFGYRLNANKLESNRNVTNCNGSRWQSLFDVKLVKVHQLYFNWHQAHNLLEMTLSVETKSLPDKIFNYKTSVFLRNLL